MINFEKIEQEKCQIIKIYSPPPFEKKGEGSKLCNIISAHKSPTTNTLTFSYIRLSRVKLIKHSPLILVVNEEFAKDISPFAGITFILR